MPCSRQSRSAVTCSHFWWEQKPSITVMICGQECPSTLLAQSETNLGEYVSRNLLFCSPAPMSTNPWWWTSDVSILTNDLVRLCLLPSSAEWGRSFWEETRLHLLLLIHNMKRFTAPFVSWTSKCRLCGPEVLLAPSASVSRVPEGRRRLQSCRFFSISAFIKYLGDITKILTSNCRGRCLLLVDALFLRPCERNKVQCWKMSFRWLHTPSLPVPEAGPSTISVSQVPGAHKQHLRSCTRTETHTQPTQALHKGDGNILMPPSKQC